MTRPWIALLLLLSLVLALAGCSRDYNLTKSSDADGTPAMVVSPHRLEFFEVSTGDTVVKAFSVANEGTAWLEVEEVRIDGAAAFAVLSEIPVRVEPGTAVDIEVAYTPFNQEDQAAAVVTSDDPGTPTDTVELVGTWAIPRLSIDPQTWDFGDMAIDCNDTVIVTLSNVGTGTLSIDQVLHTGEGFDLVDAPTLPATIAPGEGLTLGVKFSPEDGRSYTGTLWVSSNDPAGEQQGTQTGLGDANALCVTVTEGGGESIDLNLDVDYKVADIAFLIDTTSSMGSLANAMAGEFSTMAGMIQDRIPDVTFGVGTFEDYRYGDMGYTGDLPFELHQQQTSDLAVVGDSLSQEVKIGAGADAPEASMEALYQGATGMGYDQGCDGGYNSATDVPPFIALSGDAFNGSATGTFEEGTTDGGEIGGFGFRENVLPIFIFATDTELRDPDAGFQTPGGCPGDAGSTEVLNAMNAIGARIIAVGVNVPFGSAPYQQMEALASGTGSQGDMDGDGTDEPAVVLWSGTSANFRETVVDAVEGLVGNAFFDEVRLEVDGEDYGMVASISPEKYEDVPAGTDVDFSIDFVGTVEAEATDATLAIDFVLIGVLEGDEIILDRMTVYVLVPAA